jgi:hypothetical protein
MSTPALDENFRVGALRIRLYSLCVKRQVKIFIFKINKEHTSFSQQDDPTIEGVYADENNEYIVEKYRIENGDPFKYRLAIRRKDKEAMHSWSLFQDIKNQIAGDEVVAIEVYPEKSKLVDTANIYHLWVFKDGYSPKVVLIPPNN